MVHFLCFTPTFFIDQPSHRNGLYSKICHSVTCPMAILSLCHFINLSLCHLSDLRKPICHLSQLDGETPKVSLGSKPTSDLYLCCVVVGLG